jgi:hypothetical protein
MSFTFGAKYELVIGVPLQIDSANVDQLYTIREEFTLRDNQILFKVGKNNSSAANASTIQVSNAPREMIGLLNQSQGQRSIVTLKAGFDTDPVLPEIFKGVIETVKETDDGVTHTLELKLSDGASNIREFTSKRTYRKGTSIDTIIRDLIGDCGLATGPIYQIIAETYGLNYSIQDGIATLVPSFAGTTVDVIEINKDNGMVGSPSLGTQAANLSNDNTSTKEGIKVKVLMNGNIRPENFVNITSEKVNGLYKVESVKHFGDYEGKMWFTEVECKPTEFTIQNYNIPIPYRG